jgi:hypothetical protein
VKKILLLGGALMMLGADPAPAPAPYIVVSYQNGVGGYSGARDLHISSQGLDANETRGNTDKRDPELCTYTLAGEDGYTEKAILWFDLTKLPKTAKIGSARLDLVFDTWADDATLVLGYLSTPWDYKFEQLGWTHRAEGKKWSKPGIGLDDMFTKTQHITGLKPIGTQSRSIDLDLMAVQGWVNNPGANHGIIIENYTVGAVVKIRSSENPKLADRPKLTLGLTH